MNRKISTFCIRALSVIAVYGVLFISNISAQTNICQKITVNIDKSVAGSSPVSGRLLIFMRKDDGKPSDGFGANFSDPNAVFISGTEITDLSPDSPVTVDPNSGSYPAAFSTAPAGAYQLFAILDRDHSYTYGGAGAGDIYSSVEKVTMPAEGFSITLSGVVPERKIDVPANVKLVEFESPMLSKFWGRPILMKATVVLPPSYESKRSEKYPTVYTITGYGGTRFSPLRSAASMEKAMTEGKWPEMIYVNLESQVPLGHHVWADSANNGPWGTALEKEFIPYLEKQFRMDAKPSGRFVTGHSSGGWSSLWVMVSHPDFFGGTWSTSPDPVDFRNFTGPDLTKNTNAYMNAEGKEYNLVRMNGKEMMSVRQYAQQETTKGYYGGQFASFNAVFSPKGDDGQPMKLFDIDTGRIDPFVAKAWEKYDISLLLRSNWKTLGPKLKGKLHIWVGTADTFHLNEAVELLDTELKKLGSDAKIEYLEGRTHSDMYKDGLAEKIAWQMYAVARPKAKASTMK
jgi:S-formylglutathione hydrolase FrmB